MSPRNVFVVLALAAPILFYLGTTMHNARHSRGGAVANTVRIDISENDDWSMEFRPADHTSRAEDIYDVPAKQHARWVATENEWHAAQAEMRCIAEARGWQERRAIREQAKQIGQRSTPGLHYSHAPATFRAAPDPQAATKILTFIQDEVRKYGQ